MTSFQENEDIQDFLEAFEGIMGIQDIDREEWVLRLTPLLKGKAQAISTDLGNTMKYDGMKKAILSHYKVSPERCQKKFRAHVWTKNRKPYEWSAKATKLMKPWLIPEEGMEQVMDKNAVEQCLDALPQEL